VRPQIIVDTETTSLTPDYASGTGVIWELALIERGQREPRVKPDEHLWRMKPDLAKANAEALTVGRFYERTAGMCKTCTSPSRAYDLTVPALPRRDDPEWSSPSALAAEVAPLLHNVTLIAANPTFDAGFLTAFLNARGQAATWHYRLRDIGSMAWGWLSGRNTHFYADATGHYPLPDMDAGTDDFARALGIDPDSFERHSALGDCRLVAAMLDVMEGGTS
jgi:hypothetical protein